MSNRKKFRRVLLHAGLGKTGTSSIQTQLLNHAELLEDEYDIHFPRKFSGPQRFNGNHSSLLSFMFVDHHGAPQSHALTRFRSKEQANRYPEKIRKHFENGFTTSKASQLLISAEGLGHFSKPRLRLLAEWLSEVAEEVQLIVCLRHPLAALSSEIQQRLTLGYVLEDLYEQPPRYRFKNLFDRLETAFPESKFVVYDFAEATKSPDELIGFFYKKIGLDPKLVSQKSVRSNESMSHEAALLLSALNRAQPMLEGNTRSKLRSPGDVQGFLSIPGENFQAPKVVYDLLEREIVDDLAWLRERYGLELESQSITHRTDYRSFSDESIQQIALRLSKLSKVEPW